MMAIWQLPLALYTLPNILGRFFASQIQGQTTGTKNVMISIEDNLNTYVNHLMKLRHLHTPSVMNLMRI